VCLKIEGKTTHLFGEDGVAFSLVEVLTTRLQSAAVMERACWALSNVPVDGRSREREEQLK